jgi:hypothetical protein
MVLRECAAVFTRERKTSRPGSRMSRRHVLSSFLECLSSVSLAESTHPTAELSVLHPLFVDEDHLSSSTLICIVENMQL